MRLVQVASDVWEVLAIEDRDGGSVWAELEHADAGDVASEDMLVTLETEVPLGGPPRNKRKCRPIGDDILEFKTPAGGGLRVFWFYDVGMPLTRRRIICTHSSRKVKERKLQQEKRRARHYRDAYIKAKRASDLEIRDRNGKLVHQKRGPKT